MASPDHSPDSRLFYLAVGKNIKKYRDIKNYSLQILADKVGLTKKTIQRYENGEIKIDMNRLSSISDALDVKMSKMLEGTESFLHLGLGDLESVNLPVVKSLVLKDQSVCFDEVSGYEPTPASWLTTGEYFYLRSQDYFPAGYYLGRHGLMLIHCRHDVPNGSFALLSFQGNICLRKIFYHEAGLILQSVNQEDAPLFLEKGRYLILGELKKLIFDF